MWLLDQTANRFELLVIWSGVDRVGPVAVMDLLFKAYNASALPKEIDPFIVYVRSAKEEMAQSLMSIAAQGGIGKGGFIGDVVSSGGFAPVANPASLQYYYQKDWVFHLERKPRKSVQLSRDWARFSQKVEALAA